MDIGDSSRRLFRLWCRPRLGSGAPAGRWEQLLASVSAVWPTTSLTEAPRQRAQLKNLSGADAVETFRVLHPASHCARGRGCPGPEGRADNPDECWHAASGDRAIVGR